MKQQTCTPIGDAGTVSGGSTHFATILAWYIFFNCYSGRVYLSQKPKICVLWPLQEHFGDLIPILSLLLSNSRSQGPHAPPQTFPSPTMGLSLILLLFSSICMGDSFVTR